MRKYNERIEKLEETVKELNNKVWLLRNPAKFKRGDIVLWTEYCGIGGYTDPIELEILHFNRIIDDITRCYCACIPTDYDNICEVNEIDCELKPYKK